MTLQTYSTERYVRAAQEDRCAPRHRIELSAVLRPSGGVGFATSVTDLSLSGFSVRAVSGVHAGTLCWLSVGHLKGLQAEVVWNDGSSVGCAFATLLNPAVFEALVAGR